MADAIVKKLAKDHIRDQSVKKTGYLISAPEKDNRGRKLSKKEKSQWEIARYSDPRWAIPEKDLKILMIVKRRAKQLDAGHRIGPLKFGQSAILGLVPVIGDFADAILAYLRIYRKARKVSPGDDVMAFKSKMKARIVASGVIGAFPLLGDLADTILMFNTRNAASLERLLLKRSGYFEVMAKEKIAKKSRFHRNHSPQSKESIPPPRYESSHSTHRIPMAPQQNGTIEGPPDRSNNMPGFFGLKKPKAGSKTTSKSPAAPARPPRPAPTGRSETGRLGSLF